uniref:BTB domain-containing protein n=1 Tax=Meloidogyne hapla TaxID=6305 RepID=A0A1I8B8W0_MELHA
MLEYFYIGQINDKDILENHPDELFALAHKYEVKPLMDKCEIIMAEKIGKLK